MGICRCSFYCREQIFLFRAFVFEPCCWWFAVNLCTAVVFACMSSYFFFLIKKSNHPSTSSGYEIKSK